MVCREDSSPASTIAPRPLESPPSMDIEPAATRRPSKAPWPRAEMLNAKPKRPALDDAGGSAGDGVWSSPARAACGAGPDSPGEEATVGGVTVGAVAAAAGATSAFATGEVA